MFDCDESKCLSDCHHFWERQTCATSEVGWKGNYDRTRDSRWKTNSCEPLSIHSSSYLQIESKLSFLPTEMHCGWHCGTEDLWKSLISCFHHANKVWIVIRLKFVFMLIFWVSCITGSTTHVLFPPVNPRPETDLFKSQVSLDYNPKPAYAFDQNIIMCLTQPWVYLDHIMWPLLGF